MNFYDLKPRFDRITIDPYTNKKGKVIERKVHAQPGMAELVNIVAGLQKDVKRINNCLTIEGAKKYADSRPGWNAFEEDITGPNDHLMVFLKYLLLIHKEILK